MVAQLRPPLRYLQNGSWQIYGRTPTLAPVWRLTSVAGFATWTTLPPDPSFTLGVTKPDATNTGLPAGWAPAGIITGSSSGVYAPAPGSYLYRQEIRNVVDLGQDVVLDQCKIVGRQVTPGSGTFRSAVVTGTGSSPGAKMIRCEIAPTAAAGSYFMNGIEGSNIETQQCNIYNCVDSVHPDSNYWDYGSWMHHMAFYMFDGTTLGGPGTSGGQHATDSRWPGATHNDHFQGLGGGGHRLIGTNMEGYMAHADPAHTSHPGYISNANGNWASLYNDTSKGFGWNQGYFAGTWGACVTITPKTGVVTGQLINCWMDGTEVQFQMPFQGGTYPASGNNWTIAGDRWGMPHPYNSGTQKRFEHARMTPGMGTITYATSATNLVYGPYTVPSVGQNLYGDFDSVNELLSVAYPTGTIVTTSGWPAAVPPAPGNLITSAAGTNPPAQPLPFTTRVQP